MMTNIGLMLKQRAIVSTNVEAYVEPSTETRASWSDLNRMANQCASAMSSLGVKQGDRVALLMHNSIEYAALFYGAAKLGLVVVPLNTRLTASELTFILSDSGTHALFFDPEFAETVNTIKISDQHHLIRPAVQLAPAFRPALWVTPARFSFFPRMHLNLPLYRAPVF